jgi:hypothetical protein
MYQPRYACSPALRRILNTIPTVIFSSLIGLCLLTWVFSKLGVMCWPAWGPPTSLFILAVGGILVWRGVAYYGRVRGGAGTLTIRTSSIEFGAGLGMALMGVLLFFGSVLP